MPKPRKTRKPQRAFAIIDESGWVYPHSCRLEAQTVRRDWTADVGETWAVWLKNGYRVVPIIITHPPTE